MLSPTPIRRLLIANRGEIAVRIVRACRDLEIEAVVAYSEADADSLAVRMADHPVCIGPPAQSRSYLDGAALLAAATAMGVDAIHPGYGFLAENASFVRRCEEEGMTFVGPPARAVELMGDKIEARRFAADIGVPVIPGCMDPVQGDELPTVMRSLEFPAIVKAAAGGGGRGMRVVKNSEKLEEIFAVASAEAEASFGDGRLYIERYVANARHIEIQVVADSFGRVIHLGERDCTIQRRHQKLVEESPSAVVEDDVRRQMADAAIALCKHVGYRGVGTVEYLYDQGSGAFYFIEMNTRLQVEHAVTEVVTGLDLVELQLQVASGQPLPLEQADVQWRGHAVEYRINAEDPDASFQPEAGMLETWNVPQGPGVRVDTHCFPGYQIPPFYDSLLAKLVMHGATREQAIARSMRALAEFEVVGVPTTISLHRWLLQQGAFRSCNTSTDWLERVWR